LPECETCRIGNGTLFNNPGRCGEATLRIGRADDRLDLHTAEQIEESAPAFLVGENARQVLAQLVLFDSGAFRKDPDLVSLVVQPFTPLVIVSARIDIQKVWQVEPIVPFAFLAMTVSCLLIDVPSVSDA
jgi:hypothetical protein